MLRKNAWTRYRAAAEPPPRPSQAAKAAAAEMEKAEAAAAKRREEILAQADRDCEALKKEAGSRMGKAAQAILGRVVGN